MYPAISILYITARDEYPMLDLPNVSHIKLFLDSLNRQTFRSFEVIIVDALYKMRREKIEKKETDYDFTLYSFPIKHIDPNEFSWALKKGMWGLQDQINLGIIYSDGKLVLVYPDCCELKINDGLHIYWDWYMKGFFAQALFVYYKGGKPLLVNEASEIGITHGSGMFKTLPEVNDYYKTLISGGYIKDIVRDTRWKFVEDNTDGIGIYYLTGQQYYGFSSVSMEAALKLNGVDSNFDGQKALSDVEFGMRLERAGYKFVLDKNLWVIEHTHSGIPKEVLYGMPVKSWKSNYSLIMLNDMKKKITANDYKLTADELEWILDHGAKWDNPRLEPGCVEYNLLMDWYNNPPIYNLKELRDNRLQKEGKK